MQRYVAPADGAQSGLGSAKIRIATLGSVRRPIASEAHRSERRGFWGAWGVCGWWIFAGAERCGTSGLADREAGGEEKEGKGRGRGFGGGGFGFISRPPLRDGVACAGRLARAVLSWEMAFAMLSSYDWNYSGSDSKDNAWACQVL